MHGPVQLATIGNAYLCVFVAAKSRLNAFKGAQCTPPASRTCCSVHPDLSKQRVLAELLIHPLAAAVEEVAAGVAVEERQDARLQGLPPPMIPGVRGRAVSSCYRLVRCHAATQLPLPALPGTTQPASYTANYYANSGVLLAGHKQEEFKPLVKDARGFEFRPERPEAPTFVLQKWAWTGLQPGVSGCGMQQPHAAGAIPLVPLEPAWPSIHDVHELVAGDWAELEVDTEQLGAASPKQRAVVGEYRRLLMRMCRCCYVCRVQGAQILHICAVEHLPWPRANHCPGLRYPRPVVAQSWCI